MNNKFVQDSLLPDEKIIATAKFHPIRIFAIPVLLLVVMVVMGVFHAWYFPWYEIVISLIVIGGILRINLVAASREEFVFTNKRIIAKVGIIIRIAFELQSEKVESIEIHQGIIGRILNFGTLMPCGIGGSKVRIPFVVNPFEFRQHFYDLKKTQNS